MNKTISIIRIAIILVVSTFGLLFLFGEELNETLSAWTLHFIIDKTLAVLAIFFIARLCKYWSKSDRLISSYYKWILKGER